MPAYESNLFDPPAPLAHVTLRNQQTRRSLSNVPMLIDSGADVTLLPLAMVRQVEVGVLGRDILNHVSLMLNGPALAWTEAASG